MWPSLTNAVNRHIGQYQHRLVPALFASFLLHFAVAETAVRYLQIQVGVAELHPDVTVAWYPLAESVLAGTPLYVQGATDNKPPLFEFLNIAVAWTGEYVAVFLLLVGLANGLTAILLWRLFARQHHGLVGAFAACLFVTSIPLVNGHVINVRSFAVLGILSALTCNRAALRGGLVACAALFSQYAFIIAPVVVHDGIQPLSRRRTYRWMLRFSVSAIGVGVCSFGLVYLLWGWESLLASLYWSVGVAVRYFTVYGPSLWIATETWATYTLRVVTRLLPLLLAATLGAIFTLHTLYQYRNGEIPTRQRQRQGRIQMQALGLTVLFGSLLFVRPLPTYWMYSLPWLAALAAVGLTGSIDRLRRLRLRE